MAIIKCPECGHQISDRAPICPSCGVKIANQITTCPQCGEVFFKDLRRCPRCQHLNMDYQSVIPQSEEEETTPTDNPTSLPENGEQPSPKQPNKKKKTTSLLIGFFIAIAICCGGYYFYSQAQHNQEKEAYAFALASSDPIVLQDYLDRFKNAPTAHRDSILSHLSALQSMDREWTDALVSNSKTALQNYIDQHPDSPHKAEALRKIDSIDWVSVNMAHTLDAYQVYLEDHPNGAYVDMAKDGIKRINAATVQPEERAMISNLFRQYFQYIDQKDAEGLSSLMNPIISSFLGKSDANKNDVVLFLHKLYREDVASMNWHLLNDFKIEKKEIGDEEYEYSVNFSVNQDIEKVDNTQTSNHYRVKAKVNPDDKITEFNMTRIIQ